MHHMMVQSPSVVCSSPVLWLCLLCQLQKAKATTKDILAEAGKHSFAEQAMFDKVRALLSWNTIRSVNAEAHSALALFVHTSLMWRVRK